MEQINLTGDHTNYNPDFEVSTTAWALTDMDSILNIMGFGGIDQMVKQINDQEKVWNDLIAKWAKEDRRKQIKKFNKRKKQRRAYCK